MKPETKDRLLLAGALLRGIPALLCVILIGLLCCGFCFGFDPLEAPVERAGVSAVVSCQRMLDPRFFVFLENKNKYGVNVELNVGKCNNQKNWTVRLRTALAPNTMKQIYSGNPKESFRSVSSIWVTKQ
ncbi:MAG: hypothetical protein P4L53_25780 [Candidatus Obscuribacterales bacterium]|nr:hypothetical protein [Candidatus Obscuribacterales bacterium]